MMSVYCLNDNAVENKTKLMKKYVLKKVNIVIQPLKLK